MWMTDARSSTIGIFRRTGEETGQEGFMFQSCQPQALAESWVTGSGPDYPCKCGGSLRLAFHGPG